MDESGDWLWLRIKQLASTYAQLPEPPTQETLEGDVQRVIGETVGRAIDRRLVAFYVRELRQLLNDARRRRVTRGETDYTSPESPKTKNGA